MHEGGLIRELRSYAPVRFTSTVTHEARNVRTLSYRTTAISIYLHEE